MKTAKIALFAAALLAFPAPFVAPEARAQKEACVHLELFRTSIWMRMRVKSRKHVGPFTGWFAAGKTRCVDIRKVPIGDNYVIELKGAVAWNHKTWCGTNESVPDKHNYRGARRTKGGGKDVFHGNGGLGHIHCDKEIRKRQ